MGNLRACSAVAMLALAACGSDHAQPDASIKIIDSPMPDAKVWEDAPPSMYDYSCLNGTPPTTATDPVTVAGTTQTISMQGTMAVGMVVVDVYKNGTANPLATTTSDAGGAFATGNITTGGTPIDGYVKGSKATYRTTYLYPPSVVSASLTGVPVLVVTQQTFGFLEQVSGATQDDTNNGALAVLVSDCSATPTPIDGATLTVKQNGTDVGTIFDLGALAPQAAGTFFVFNVPDGATQLSVSADGHDFPVRTVLAHKKPNGQGAEGTLTVTQVRPGP